MVIDLCSNMRSCICANTVSAESPTIPPPLDERSFSLALWCTLYLKDKNIYFFALSPKFPKLLIRNDKFINYMKGFEFLDSKNINIFPLMCF